MTFNKAVPVLLGQLCRYLPSSARGVRCRVEQSGSGHGIPDRTLLGDWHEGPGRGGERTRVVSGGGWVALGRGLDVGSDANRLELR